MKNQNRFLYKRTSPFIKSEEKKNSVLKFRSKSKRVIAAANTGKEMSNRKDTVNSATIKMLKELNKSSKSKFKVYTLTIKTEIDKRLEIHAKCKEKTTRVVQLACINQKENNDV
jgi:NADH:ubiquinone oxidoreductase subunit C